MKKWYHYLLPVMAVSMIAVTGCSKDDDNNPVDPGPSGPTVLTGTITSNTTLTADKEYLLRGGVFVGTENDVNKSVTLTIQAGTKIYGESATDGMLVIRRGGKIMADGRADAPIVFTSDKAVGSRQRGDWGGVIINGWAPVNVGEGVGEGGTGRYGGNNPTDNSGVLKYVRVEFAGREISPDNELNGIAFQGVGSGTTVDYIQVHMNKDDGIEMFGGTVNVKHAYVSGVDDDMFDWTEGWVGKGQFWVGQQYRDVGDRGIEADNNAENNDATPRSNPLIYNVTLIGEDTTGASNGPIGMNLRVGTGARIYNAIVHGFRVGIDLDDAATFNHAWNGTGLSGSLVVNNSIFFANSRNAQTGETGSQDETTFPFTTDRFLTVLNANNRFVDPGLQSPNNERSPDYTLRAGAAALSGYANPPSDGFFEAVTYVGGVGSVNWLSGWTTNAAN